MEIITNNEFKFCKLICNNKIYNVPYFLLKHGKIFENYFSEYDLSEYDFEFNNFSNSSISEFINLLIDKYINHNNNNKSYDTNTFLETLEILYKYEFVDLMIEYFMSYYFNNIFPKINKELINILLKKYNFNKWKNTNNENIYDLINVKILNQEIDLNKYYKNFDISYFDIDDELYKNFLIFNNTNINLYIIINIFNNNFDKTFEYILKKYETYKNLEDANTPDNLNFAEMLKYILDKYDNNEKLNDLNDLNVYIHNDFLKKFNIKIMYDFIKNNSENNILNLLTNILNCYEKNFNLNCINFYLIDPNYIIKQFYKIFEKINKNRKDIINDNMLLIFKNICCGNDELIDIFKNLNI
jgi:hypothetical protein